MKSRCSRPNPILRLASVVVAVVLGLQLGGNALATTLQVTKTSDTNDGACDSRDCSLREAIIAANSNPGSDTILVPEGTFVFAILGAGEELAASGDLDILDAVTIRGVGEGSNTGTVIDANGIDRVFDVWANGNQVALLDLTIQGGNGNLGGDGTGGGIYVRSGIVSVEGSTIQSNAASQGGGISTGPESVFEMTKSAVSFNNASTVGGGIASRGASILTEVTINGNRASGSSGAGGGAWIAGNAILTRCAIAQNEAIAGGGGIVATGDVSLVESTVSENRAGFEDWASANPGVGGGIAMVMGRFSVVASTISRNVAIAGGAGGGMHVENAKVAVENSTISGNRAEGSMAVGGGIAINNSVELVELTHSTISDNWTWRAGSAVYYLNESSGVTLANTLIKGNCAAHHGQALTRGGNLESPGDTCGLTDPTDRVNVSDPRITPLGDHGGPTQTHALFANSPAIDAAVSENCLPTDQRGVSRPQPPGSNCDAGSYEYKASSCGSAIAPAFALPPVAWFTFLRRSVRRRRPVTTVS